MSSMEIKRLDEKLNKIEGQLNKSQAVINAHPMLFVFLLVGFFVSMDFWAVTAHMTLKKIHPRGELSYWEYLALSILTLGFVIWIGNLAGIQIQTIQS